MAAHRPPDTYGSPNYAKRRIEMSRMADRRKAAALLVLIVLVLSAIVAGPASAQTWTTNVTMPPESTMDVGTETGSEGITFFGEVSGVTVELASKKQETSAHSTINQGKKEGVASLSAEIKFSELSLLKPAACSAPTSITTKPIQGEVATVPALTSGVAIKLRPKEGSIFATITLTGECALAGTPFKVTVPEGKSLFGELEKYGTMSVKQPMRFSASINKAAGGTLEAGGSVATLSGTALAFSKETIGGPLGVANGPGNE